MMVYLEQEIFSLKASNNSLIKMLYDIYNRVTIIDQILINFTQTKFYTQTSHDHYVRNVQ